MSSAPHGIDALPGVIDALGSEEFTATLMAYIRATTEYDSGVIMGYPHSGGLSVIYNALHEGDLPGFSGAYRKGLWLLSPLYLSARSGIRGFFHILDIAPDNFYHSDYYNLYYRCNGVLDHCGFLVESGDGTPVAISLERTPRLNPYSAVEKSALANIASTVGALVRKHWPAAPAPGAPANPELHHQVQQVLQEFGRDLLTRREREVMLLVLQGHPSKTIARKLGISSQTEQVHRKNIYQKLGLSSHNELFSQFFFALVRPRADINAGIDNPAPAHTAT